MVAPPAPTSRGGACPHQATLPDGRTVQSVVKAVARGPNYLDVLAGQEFLEIGTGGDGRRTTKFFGAGVAKLGLLVPSLLCL